MAKSMKDQLKESVDKKPKKKKEFKGNTETMISTGSTLLDLAISGGRVRGGGLPSGILCEIFGPSGSGKTVLLSEIAGGIQRQKGDLIFADPEARLNKNFAAIFDLNIKDMGYKIPNTVPELFKEVHDMEGNDDIVNGIVADSLAALSTDMELSDKGDKMGMRRAKEFSEELRKACRIIQNRNLLMVCSNQVRINQDGGPFAQKYISPGGESIGFYSSVRLRTFNPRKIKQKISVAGKQVERVSGVETLVEVYKNSVWEPYHKAGIVIDFQYGIDNIRTNLQYLKDYTKASVYSIGDLKLDRSMEKSILMVEEDDLENKLENAVINLWEEIQEKFTKNERKPKKRS